MSTWKEIKYKRINKKTMNNLEKAKRAIAGTKTYKVYLTDKTCYTVEIEAKSEEEACDLAREEVENGNISDNGNGGLDIDSIELIN